MLPSVLIAAVLCLSLTNVTRVSADTLDDVVARNVEAKGGLARLRAIETITQTIEMSMHGQRASVVVRARRPNLSRQEVTVGGRTLISGFDGVAPWIIDSLSGATSTTFARTSHADLIESHAAFDGPLTATRPGQRVELAGIDRVDGRDTFHLRIIDGLKPVEHRYLDVTTCLEVKVVQDVDGNTIEQRLSDYRDVQGVMVPFVIETRTNGRFGALLTVKAVQFNLPLEDGLFAPTP